MEAKEVSIETQKEATSKSGNDYVDAFRAEAKSTWDPKSGTAVSSAEASALKSKAENDRLTGEVILVGGKVEGGIKNITLKTEAHVAAVEAKGGVKFNVGRYNVKVEVSGSALSVGAKGKIGKEGIGAKIAYGVGGGIDVTIKSRDFYKQKY